MKSDLVTLFFTKKELKALCVYFNHADQDGWAADELEEQELLEQFRSGSNKIYKLQKLVSE